jgi:uncharacterized membrane protein YagU involved in acid resistance
MLTRKEAVILIALLTALIAGGIARLYKKGWAPPQPAVQDVSETTPPSEAEAVPE